ncbi:MAG: hypothetical protein R2821_07115 [Flavobacteriaceae bacterium]
MNDWAEQFDCSIFLPESEKDFIVNPTDRITFWTEEKVGFWDGIELIRIGVDISREAVFYGFQKQLEKESSYGDTFNLSLYETFLGNVQLPEHTLC